MDIWILRLADGLADFFVLAFSTTTESILSADDPLVIRHG